MIEGLYKIRLKKAINLIMSGKSLQKNILCVEELKVFSSLNDVLRTYLENLTLILKGESPQEFVNDGLYEDYLIVRFLREVPQIMGSDLKEYGPFLIDDIAILPKEHVEPLLEHKAIVLIKKSRLL